MKIMTRKISACLMPLLLFFYLAMSPVALANNTGTDVNVVTLDGGAFLNMLENGGVAARSGGYRRPTPKEDWQSTPSDEKSNWKEYQKEKIKNKIERAIDNVTKKQDCLEKAQEYCQSNYIQNSTESCHQYALRVCQPRYKKYTPKDSEETIKNRGSRKYLNRPRLLERNSRQGRDFRRGRKR